MRTKLIAVVLLACGVIGLAQTPSSQPIKMEEADALRLQIVYQQAIAAQNQLENGLLRAKVKYKVPVDWNYDFDKGAFVPPPVAAPPPKAPDKPPGERPK